MRLQKTRRSSSWPDAQKIKDEATRQFGADLGQLIVRAFNTLFEDISSLQTAPDVVDSLPTASSDIRGRIFLLRGGAGVADTAHICRKNAADAYEFYAL